MEDHAGEIASVFRRFDFDKDGTIRRDELARVLRSLDPDSFDDGAVDALLVSADKNKDGTIDYEEFAIWVTEDPGHNVMSRSNKLDHTFLTHAKRFEWHAVFDLLERRPDLINCHIAGRWSVLHQVYGIKPRYFHFGRPLNGSRIDFDLVDQVPYRRPGADLLDVASWMIPKEDEYQSRTMAKTLTESGALAWADPETGDAASKDSLTELHEETLRGLHTIPEA